MMVMTRQQIYDRFKQSHTQHFKCFGQTRANGRYDRYMYYSGLCCAYGHVLRMMRESYSFNDIMNECKQELSKFKQYNNDEPRTMYYAQGNMRAYKIIMIAIKKQI